MLLTLYIILYGSAAVDISNTHRGSFTGTEVTVQMQLFQYNKIQLK